MKTILSIIALCAVNFLFAQDFLGDWHGKLEISGMPLRITFHVSKTDAGLASTMDSPDQKAFDIPMTSTTVENGQLIITSKEMGATYKAALTNNELQGIFAQGGTNFPLNMTRNELEKTELKRPQEPKEPFNYEVTEVSFSNDADKVTLSGTLTTPKGKGKFPVAILISGSGPQNRNEELLGHKPFLVIADYLTKNGISVLRYDDRGTAKSTGNFDTATSEDFAKDAEAAIAFLKTQKKIDKSKIGLIGHSEGGLIAPMVASKTENGVAFVIMLAGPGISGSEILILQQELIARAEGESEKSIKETKIWSEDAFAFMKNNMNSPNFDDRFLTHIQDLNTRILDTLPPGVTLEELSKTQYDALNNPWMKFFLLFDPKEALQKTTCPILALNGEKDLQVPFKENLEAIKKYTSNNKNAKVVALPNLNHLFQHTETGAPNEYAKIEETFSPEVLALMKDWILGLK